MQPRLRISALALALIATTAGTALGISGGTAGASTTPSLSTAIAASSRATSGGVSGNTAVKTYNVTLLTGDRVQLQRLPGGKRAANIIPGPGREQVSFQQTEVDGDLIVIPEDVTPFLTKERIDRALFNVDELIEQGYDDAKSRRLPLILSYGKNKRPGSLASTSDGRVLESINALAVGEDKKQAGEFWQSIAGSALRALSSDELASDRLAGGVERIRLDRKVRANLDKSVPQIGATEAWKAGFDGSGVKVAVLDTGVDTTHPDLAGVVTETRNFSTSPTTEDKFGHGTHVSATVAGSGNASGGLRKGVAPGARLLVGKVLGDDGWGQESWVMDGMEWAAHSGAKVVNLSLGSGPSDGTDDVSQALNRLTQETGTLFVTSAGNDGEDGDYTIGSPGSADAALTIGAVGRDESLASFSSRGPRLGDFGLKPDVTAPGVDIVAARAKGTGMGSPVDDNYTAASGTSMAAPHVAGAAAILAQQHPAWTAQQIKDSLTSTAVRNTTLKVTEQGAGRIDVARATAQGVFGTGSLGLGLYQDSDTTVVQKEVSYTNTSSDPVTLSLKLDVKGTNGKLPAEGAIALGATSVTVAPGETKSVPVTLDPAKLARGLYNGYLEATADNVVVHTTVGVTKEAPTHKVTFMSIGLDGKSDWVNPITVFGEDSRFDAWGSLFPNRPWTGEFAEGTYFVHGVMSGKTPTGEEDYIIDDPSFEVTEDTTFVFDARKANQVKIITPKPATQQGILSFYSTRVLGERRVSHYQMEFDTVRRLYATPTERLPRDSYEFGTRWQLAKPMLTVETTGRESLSIESYLLNRSPLLEGKRRLPIVDVGAGLPEDYAGKDVKGKVALVTMTDWEYEDRTADAAKAGAALALVAVTSDANRWTKWNPSGTRIAGVGAKISYEDGQALLGLLRKGAVQVDVDGTPSSPYLYDVQQISQGQIPTQINYRVSSANSATVETKYHESGGKDWQKLQRFAWRPWQESAINQYQRLVRTPHVRQEIVTAGDTLWQNRVKYYLSWDDMNPLGGGMTQAPQRYRVGEHRSESWWAPVTRAGIPSGVPGLTSDRTADSLRIRIPEWTDSERGHYAFAEGDKVNAKLYRDGTLVAEAPEAWGEFPAVQGRSTYRLDLDVQNKSAEWAFATRTQTSWTFGSERPKERTLLPLLQLDYDLDTDLRNQVTSGRPFTFDIRARHQDGFTGARVKSMQAWVSYDDGASWRQIRALVPLGSGKYRAIVVHPKPQPNQARFVSLRTKAVDSQGNAVEQTILRAHALK